VQASKLPGQGASIFTVMSALSNQYKAINLSQGFPEFNPHPALIDCVNRAMHDGLNQYSPMAGQPNLRGVLADRQNRWGRAFAIDPDKHITIVPGATAGLYSIFQALVLSGDEVILFDPSYDCYAPSIQLAGGVPVRLSMNADGSYPFESLKQHINPKTKMVVVNTPHNPLGLVFGQSDWNALSEILANTDIIVLSDEVYEHMVLDDAEHISVLQIPELANRAVAVSSFGKTFHATGWKLGYVTAPENLTQEIRKVYQFLAFAANTPMQIAAAEFLTNHPNYEESVSLIMQGKRDLFVNALQSSRFRLLPCQGAYFQIADYSDISDMPDQDFAVHLIKTIGVATIPVSAFYQNPHQEQRWLRFCFAKNEETLLKSAEFLCQL
jgi:methionine aminotransferase